MGIITIVLPNAYGEFIDYDKSLDFTIIGNYENSKSIIIENIDEKYTLKIKNNIDDTVKEFTDFKFKSYSNGGFSLKS